MCKQKLLKDPNIIDQKKHFTETLISIPNETIAKTSASNKHSTPWFNDDCRTVICLHKAALKKFDKEPTTNKLNAFKFLRTKKKKNHKRSQEENYVNQLGSSTRTNTIWTMMRKISRKSQPTALKHLTRNKTEATTKKDIAETFSVNSSMNNSNPHYFTFKNNVEKKKLNFNSNNSEKYNQPFKPAELKEAIKTSHNTAVGPNEIHYLFLKHLPKNSLDYLLTIFNDIWINSKFPESWKIARIILIPKPGRDSSNPANYCPIALTSCLCKTMEHMANKRLVWFLKSNKLITNSKCGFRK